MNRNYREVLDSVAALYIPGDLDLFARLQRQLGQRRSFMQTVRTRPVLAIALAILALLLLTGVAYAIGRLTGYIPGIGFVQRNSLRVLAAPVSQTRDGITVTIEQVTVDSQRTIIVYKAEGLTIAAANSKGEGGPFGSPNVLRLQDGTTVAEAPDLGYAGTPEPLIDNIRTQGGWPSYVWRLTFPALPQQVNDVTLLIPVLQTMPPGAAPENWEISFRLQPAPANMTFAPITELAPAAPQGQGATQTGVPALSSSASANGFTFQLDSVIELQDGFLFTGNLSWNNAAFPSGKGLLAEAPIPTLTDTSGYPVPIEQVSLNGASDDHHAPWSYRTNRKAFAGPLTLSIPSIKMSLTEPAVDFETNFGTGLQVGQSWEIDRDFAVQGHVVRLLSISLGQVPDTCEGVGLNFSFQGDVPGMGAFVDDMVPAEPMVCSSGHGGGGGGGGPVDPTLFSASLSYRNTPSGMHHYAISFLVPVEVQGPWQVAWNPPASAAPTPTPEGQACLTHDQWQQIIDQGSPLPSGLKGKLLTTVDEGGMLPSVNLLGLGGTALRKYDSGSWPSLSPDGQHLVYGSGDALHVVDLSTGQDTTFVNDGYAHHWSPDSSRLLYTTTFGLYVMNPDGSGLQKIDTGTTQVISVVGWLPDGQTVVYGAMGGAGFTFTTYNLETGETKALFTIQNKAGYGALSPDGQWIVFADRVFGASNWGIFISRLDGSERRLVADPSVPTAFTSIWGPDGQWLVLNTQAPNSDQVPVLVNPFTCQAATLSRVNGVVEGWSP